MRAIPIGAAALLLAASLGAAALPGVVQKPSADVYAAPRLDAAKLTALKRNARVDVTAQQGLWYQLKLPAGAPGYVRVNDVRLAAAKADDGEANLRVLMGGKGGAGRVTETAGVRGIDESDLKAAALDPAQLDAMIANRVDAAAAAADAKKRGWQATAVAYAGEPKRSESSAAAAAGSAASQVSAAESLAGRFGMPTPQLGSLLGRTKKAIPKSEAELSAEELALGPQIAGRVLGARPLWRDAAAQQRVNRIGRWVASQTSRADLPWTFGVIDTPELNAFAAPGGFVLVTRGLYELLASDAEVAAVLGHEIGHCVRRDHYEVIRKQELASAAKEEALSDVRLPADAAAASFAQRYVEEFGASVMLTSLDREAEYRADEAAEIYVARAGANPIALYAVLQKMASLGNEATALAQLHKTHPALDDRLDRIDRRGYAGLEAYTARE
jgi:hypothetical protein